MKILFYDTQNYDRESFDRTKEQFPGKGLRCRVRLRKLRCRNKNRRSTA